MKEESEKSIAYNLISLLKKVIICFVVLIIVIVGSFVLYVNKHSDVSSIDTTGIYNLVDSEGNVIATDLDSEDIKVIMEILNGKN